MTLQELYSELVALVSNDRLTLTANTPGLDNFQGILHGLRLSELILTIDPENIVYTAGNELDSIVLSPADFQLFDRVCPGDLHIEGTTTENAIWDMAVEISDTSLQTYLEKGIFEVPSSVEVLLPQNPFPLASLRAKGRFTTVDNSQIAYLVLTCTGSSQSYAPLASIGVELSDLGYRFENWIHWDDAIEELENGESPYVESPVFMLTGTWMLGSTEMALQLGLPTRGINIKPFWDFTISSPVNLVDGLSDLVSLTTGYDLFGKLPPGFSSLSGFELTNFNVRFNPNEGKLYVISMEVGTANPWTTASGYFTVQSASFKLRYENYSGESHWRFFLFGDFQYLRDDEDAVISVSLRIPYPTSNWQMQVEGIFSLDNFSLVPTLNIPGTSSEISNLIDALILPTQVLNSTELEVHLFQIIYDPGSSTVTSIIVDVKFDLGWSIDYQGTTLLAIYGASLALNFTNPLNSNRAVTGKIIALIGLYDYAVVVSAIKSEKEGSWVLSGELQSGVQISDLVNQLLAPLNISLPDFFTNDPYIENIAASVDLSTSAFTFSGNTQSDWVIQLTSNLSLAFGAAVDLQYDPSNTSAPFAGSLISGSASIPNIGLTCNISYLFQADNNVLTLEWNGFTTTYLSGDNTITFKCGNLTLGYMMSYMVQLVTGNNRFTLPSPWNLLNDISLNGFELVLDLNDNSLSFSYTLDRKLELFFITIYGLSLTKEGSAVNINLDCTLFGQKTNEAWDLVSDSPPDVPNIGSGTFDLQYLGLGQHVSLATTENISNVQEATDAYKKAFQDPEDPDGNPLDGNSAIVFNPNSNWLIGTQFSLMGTVGLSLIFNDPDIYGLLLEVMGEKAGALAGLRFEILYKKITEGVGMYKAELKLPDKMRRIDMGGIELILPVVGCEIYTNGDFRIDLGYPYDGDFSRAMRVQVFPFTGAGGFYVAKLSADTAQNVPQTDLGVFDPVTEFGLGLDIGLGADVSNGIMKAGLSLTLQGFLDGVVANYTSKDGSTTDNYYWMQGSLALVGKVFATIDFKVVRADFDLVVYASIRAIFESYRAIEIYLKAGVNVKLQVQVKLGLFKIKVNCSFSTTIEETYVIGRDSIAPWEAASSALLSGRYNALATRRSPRRYVRRSQRLSQKASEKWVPQFRMQRLVGETNVVVPLIISTQPAVTGVLDGNANTTTLWQQSLLAILKEDAAKSSGYGEFNDLVDLVFAWVLSSFVNDTGAEEVVLVDRAAFAESVVSIAEIDATFTALTTSQDLADSLINFNSLQTFFSDNLQFSLWSTNLFTREGELSCAAFPMLPNLTLTVPGQDPIDFSSYNMVGQDYVDALNVFFASLQQPQETELAPGCLDDLDGNAAAVRDNNLKSMATFVFEDYFNTIAKNALQYAMDLLDAWPWTFGTESRTTINAILNYVNQFSTSDMANALTVTQFADANQHVNFRNGRPLTIPRLEYQVNESDTLSSIAATYNTDSATLASYNADLHNLLLGGVEVTLGGDTYTLTTGQSFTDLAGETGLTVAEIGTALGTTAGILRPMALMDIPSFSRNTSTALSWAGLSELYNMDVADLANANAGVANLYPNGVVLTLPSLNCMPVSKLTEMMIGQGMYDSLAAQISKGLLSGERLPLDVSLTGTSDLSQVETETLYRLTGQQVDISSLLSLNSYSFVLSVAQEIDWLEIGPYQFGNTQVRQDITEEIFSDWKELPSTNFNAGIQTFGVGALYEDAPVRFTAGNARTWQSAAGISLPNGGSVGNSAGTPYSLWGFPANLNTRLSNLGTNLPTAAVKVVEQALTGLEPTTKTISKFGFSTELSLSLQRTVRTAEDGSESVYYDVLGADVAGTSLLQRLVAYVQENGADIIDNAYFLFPSDQSEGDAMGLQSDNLEDLVVYLTQVNLSTETNPPSSGTSDLQSQDYILNPMASFVQLLWQASVVRSGGYFLTYENSSEGRGIPESVFVDNDISDITLVLVYNSSSRLQGFMNAVVLGEIVNQGSQSIYIETTANSVSYTPQEGDTLKRIASAHYTTVTRLAEDLQEERLKARTELRIYGGVLQVAPGENLKRILRRYELEEELFAEGADLSHRSEEERILELAEFTYTTRRRDSLASLAERFQLTVQQLAAQNAEVPDLFRRSELSFNDQWMDRIPVAPVGSVALRMVRNNPGDSLDSNSAFIANAYNLFSYQLTANNNFQASNPELPMSPTMGENEDIDTGKWNYNKVIPAYRLATNKRMSNVNGMPPASENPYAGIGNNMVFSIGLRDYFGNETTVNGRTSITTKLGYIDPLIHIGAWPGLGIDYEFIKVNSLAGLVVNFDFDPSAYQLSEGNDLESVEQRICVDKAVYRTIYYQLSQPDIFISWELSISPSFTFMSDKDFLLEMVEAIYKYLEAVESNNSATPPTLSAYTLENIFADSPGIRELRTAMRISRDERLVASGFTDVESVYTVVTELIPKQFQNNDLGEEEYGNLTTFATDFEETFALDGAPTLKIAVGRSHLDPVIGPEGSNIWVVNVSSYGVQFEVETDHVRFYAVPPISFQLYNGKDVGIPAYKTGEGLDLEPPFMTQSFSNVSLQAWAAQFLQDVEHLLSAELGHSAQLLDFIAGTSMFTDFLSVKETLANKISMTLSPILQGTSYSYDQIVSAREKIRQELLVNLYEGNTLSAMVQFDVDVTSPFSGQNVPRYFGKATGSSGDTETASYSLSTSKIPLNKDHSELNLAFNTRYGAEETSFEIDLKFTINNLEAEIQSVDGVEGYKASTWLSYVIPLSEISLGTVEIPLLDRQYPSAPLVNEQKAIFTHSDIEMEAKGFSGAEIIENAVQWSLQYGYARINAPQDNLTTRVEFNLPKASVISAENSEGLNSIFSSLATWNVRREAILADLETYLPLVTPASAANSEEVVNAQAAVASFLTIAQSVADFWGIYTFANQLSSGGDYAYSQYQIEEKSLNGDYNTVLSLEASEGDGMTVPWIEIPGYTTEALQTGDYLFKNDDTGAQLTFAEGLTIDERVYSVPDLDLRMQQSAQTGVKVVRNEELIPGQPTYYLFTYTSQWTSPIGLLLPSRTVKSPINVAELDNASGESRSLSAQLTALFNTLFDPGTDWEQMVRTSVMLSQTLNEENTLGTTEMPVIFSPPVEISLENGSSKYITELTSTLKNWYTDASPATYNQQFKIDLTVYSKSGDQKPLLRLQNLYLKVEDISDL